MRKGFTGSYYKKARSPRILLSWSPYKLSLTGFTLVELLVAITIFTFLTILLASLLTSGLDMWRRGETGSETSARTQEVLLQLQKDISSAFANQEAQTVIKNEFVNQTPSLDNAVYYPEPSFYAAPDANGNHWLYLTVRNSGDKSKTYQRDKIEHIAYGISGTSLIRTVFTADNALDFWRREIGARTTLAQVTNIQITHTFDNIIYFGLTFLDKATKCDSRRTTQRAQRVALPQPNCYLALVQTLPETAEVELVSRSVAPGITRVVLVDALSSSAQEIKLNTTRPAGAALPDAGGYVRIDNEWLQIKEKDRFGLKVARRGCRNTVGAAHQKGAEVLFGETMKVLVAIGH
ncbi:MAG: type II secretion system protein [Planctomycetes bacterium]|nr:type II secretion system protein [Planctomycetota bacterium]